MDARAARVLLAAAALAVFVAAVVAFVAVRRLARDRPRPDSPAPPPADRREAPGSGDWGGPEPAPAPRPAPGPTDPTPLPPADPSPHLALGNPSRATDDPAARDNFLMRKPQYALSYNDARGGPNWVSWRLAAADLGTATRGQFFPDPGLPRGFRRVTPRDYTNTGFDRGHLCPRSDRTATPEDANATFAMTNIVPQSPHLNQRAWADLEDHLRGLVRGRGKTLYVVAGPHGRGGEGSMGRADAIAGGRVAVPASCWKVVVAVDAVPGGTDPAAAVGHGAEAFGVIMPNDQSVGHGWARYKTSVLAVELLTGYSFFDRVPAAVAGPLKAKGD